MVHEATRFRRLTLQDLEADFALEMLLKANIIYVDYLGRLVSAISMGHYYCKLVNQTIAPATTSLTDIVKILSH